MDLLRWGKIVFAAGLFAAGTGCWHAEPDTNPFEQALADDVPVTLRGKNAKTDAARRSNSLLAKADAVDSDLHSPLEKQLAMLRDEARQQRQELSKSRSTAEELKRRSAELQGSLRATEDRIARIEKVMRLLGEDPRVLDADSSLEAGAVLSLGGHSGKMLAEHNDVDLNADLSALAKSRPPENIGTVAANKKTRKKYPGVGEEQFADIPMPELRIERAAKTGAPSTTEKLLAEISALPSSPISAPESAAEVALPTSAASGNFSAPAVSGDWQDVSAIGDGWTTPQNPTKNLAKKTVSPAPPAWTAPSEIEVGGEERALQNFSSGATGARIGANSNSKSRVILCDGTGKDATYIISRRAGDDMSEGALYQAANQNVLVVTEVYATNAKAKLHPRFANGEIAINTPLSKITRLSP